MRTYDRPRAHLLSSRESHLPTLCSARTRRCNGQGKVVVPTLRQVRRRVGQAVFNLLVPDRALYHLVRVPYTPEEQWRAFNILLRTEYLDKIREALGKPNTLLEHIRKTHGRSET